MKLLSACVILCLYFSNVVGVSEEMQEVIDMLHNTCKEQSGVAEDVIVAAQKGNFAEDGNLKCYIKCIMAEMSTIGDDGKVDEEAAAAILPPELQGTLGVAIKKCGTQAGVDICDTAFKTFKCYHTECPKDFFLP